MVSDRKTVNGIDFIGEVTFPTGFVFDGTTVGGLSGIVYDSNTNSYYSISDDRSSLNPARFYTLNIDLSDGSLDAGDVVFTDVTTLLDDMGMPFPLNGIDPEGITLTDAGTLYISSEGDAAVPAVFLLDPFVNEFALNGQQLNELPVPNKFLPTVDASNGIRNNLAFESLTITPDQRYLYTATENALFQDGPAASVTEESPNRILRFDLTTGQPDQEFVYFADPVVNDSAIFSTSGLVELLAIDNSGTFLSLERSFAVETGNNIKLYEVRTQGNTDVSGFNSLGGDPANDLFAIDAVAEKRLLLDFDDLGLTLDNDEGLAFGPTLPNGQQSLIVVSDNNFNPTQFTQFLAFGLDIGTIPEVPSTLETPQVIRFGDPVNPNEPDPDDPAIYVHPTDSANSFVITAHKNGGLDIYDLDGQRLQLINPAGIRYNNVDIIYGFNLGGRTVDLAIASDRFNDTIAIFEINPTTRSLTDITGNVPIIFNGDPGEDTAYGLAAYTSLVDGSSYVFVSQADGDRIAQIELTNGGNVVNANVVRELNVPIPPGGDVEDAQVEGMVVDRELGFLYAGQEGFGIFKFQAEPNGNPTPTIVDVVEDISPNGRRLESDVEGLTIYYGADGTGYLFASSQGNNTYAIYTREGSNTYLGSFAIGDTNPDAVDESDGADVINVPLGSQFPFGLLVTQDGSDEPQQVTQDPEDGEIQNFAANFKYTAFENIANTFPGLIEIDTTSYDPRNPQPQTLINGVASGDTDQNSTVLWANSSVPGLVKFEYADTPTFNNMVGMTTAMVTDANVPVKVEVDGLNPNTRYWYRVTDAAGDTAEGQFRTAAPFGRTTGLRFGVSGDWRGEIAPYPAIANADERNLAFFVEHGDTIYADFPSDGLLNDDGTRKAQAETLDEYRAKHLEVYSDRFGKNFWEDLRASTSIFATIDDHEVTNDFAGGADVSTDPRFTDAPGTLINDSMLFENGLQAFQEFNPIRDEFYGATGDPRTAGERKLYRFNTYGSDAATFILDNRSFRDTPLVTADVSNPLDVFRFLTESLDPSRTMLGEAQMEDLKQDLLNAQRQGITWKFVMVPEPIQNLGVAAAEDRFEGYAAERNEILSFINDNHISNVVFVAADIHGTLVNNLTYQEGVGTPQIPTSAFEITTGSVAFDEPFGPTVIDLADALGVLPPGLTRAVYDTLPRAAQDDIIKDLVDAQLNPLGYDPLGLDNNLPIADGLIDATLLQGDYVATNTYGWTEFEIEQNTKQLTVTTYGIDFYGEDELLADPQSIVDRTPEIVSQFTIDPQRSIAPLPGQQPTPTPSPSPFPTPTPTPNPFPNPNPNPNPIPSPVPGSGNNIIGTNDNDFINGSFLNDQIEGLDGDDNIFGNAGDDILIGGSGSDRILGQAGNDLIIGVDPTDANPGIDELDLLSGGTLSDTFVLGDASGAFYDDGFFGSSGQQDRAFISDFELSIDLLQVSNIATYVIANVAGGAGIFIDEGAAGFDPGDELIAILAGLSAANATQIENRFVFV
jgi:myo-inositol-hexaphosphate 3-phosphohydrolase/phosphodiesterase/alkaline phosphatase D-like protein